MNRAASTILDLIGNTPLVNLSKLSEECDGTVWGKLESFNPMGSVKDRISLAMVLAAEDAGILQPGGTIVEPTSGNTGIGLAMVSAARGYHLILTMPDTMSHERREILSALGAQLVLTPGSDGMKGAINAAKVLVAEKPDYYMPDQFANPANPDIHRKTTAPEIIEQAPEPIDAFVAGVGTGGTITGVGEVLKARYPDVQVVAVEPEESPVLSGGQPGPHKIQGIGAGFIPDILDREVIDDVVLVGYDDARDTCQRLARECGILAGISAGANVWAALQIARKLGSGKTIVTIICDTGERYLSTLLFSSKK